MHQLLAEIGEDICVAVSCLCSWIQYYLSLDSLGPTVGVPVTYAAPDTAFKALSVDLPATDAPRDKATGLQSDRQAAPNRHNINVREW